MGWRIESAVENFRREHGSRTPMSEFVDENCACRICGTTFQSRLRCIAHLSDTRCSQYRTMILAGGAIPLSPERVRALDGKDRVARLAARRQGHTQPIAAGAAETSSWRHVGRVKA